MATVEEAFEVVSETFKISCLNTHQKSGIRAIVIEKKDVFINLPTGYGKSLLYQALPLMFDLTSQEPGHIVVVVSPLVSLMEDQVSNLRALGIKAVNISSLEDGQYTSVEKGEYSVVYGSPEAWLKNERWRLMLTNPIYSKKLCAIAVDEAHVVRQWGTSQDKKMAPFRESYSRLHELRSLAPNVPMVALTATATKLTKDTILNLLSMSADTVEISESPNKLNVSYVVQYMDKNTELEFYFSWLCDELKTYREKTERTIIYCQTIRQCGLIYATLKALLGKEMFVGEDSRNVLVEMLHSCSPTANKQNILESFRSETGSIRLLVATIAFGMGVDCRGVHRVIHFGPSKNVEAYVQETGRAGRDGNQSVVYVLYHGIMLNHVDNQIKSFVKTEDCRRKNLLTHFDSVLHYPEPIHICCDNCATRCSCGIDHTRIMKYPVSGDDDITVSGKEREILPQQKKAVENDLIKYHKTVVMELVGASAHGNVKTLTNVQFMLGFSQHQITQVLNNLHRIFSLVDIYNFIEIWDKRHAQKILSIVANVFQDINVHVESDSDVPVTDVEFDDELLDEWQEYLQDDDLYDMIVDNLSLSELEPETSALEELDNAESDDEISPAVLATVENLNMALENP